MLLLLGAFIAGILTVLAPCVLPLLPIIIGGSVTGNTANRKRPLLITSSLAVSLILFTLLLKATTLLISIPPQLLTYISGGIIVALGLVTLFPFAYSTFMARIGIEGKAQQALNEGSGSSNSIIGPIIVGAALGPVFSSCSPVYAYILATILPVSFTQAIIYIVAYVLGLSAVLLLIATYGQRLIGRFKFASRPNGWFQRTLAIVFIIVGLLVLTGNDKRLQTWVSAHTPFNFDALSAKLIPGKKTVITNGVLFNVKAYPAPEFTGLQDWINSPPLTLQSLHGKVVLVDFWTYSCINCIRNNPYLEKWSQAYSDQGLVVVGIHAPEFAFEKVSANVEKAVKDQGIMYPVALDNEYSTWNAFHNQYWPASYLIDAQGMVRRVHYGEGEYKESEDAIRALLKEKGASLSSSTTTTGSETVPVENKQTPETYLGSLRAGNYLGSPALAAQPISTFTAQNALQSNQWTLSGTWEVQSEKIIARGNSLLTIKVSAKETYLVAGSSEPKSIKVQLNGNNVSASNAGSDLKDSQVTIGQYQLYRLISLPSFTKDSVITLQVPDGVELNVFTFGG